MDNLSSKRRDHLANERTFLAWIRTSIGLMAFGFVIEKFSLFVKEVSLLFSHEKLPLPEEHSSSIFGIILVGFGGLVGVFSYFRYYKIGKQIEIGEQYIQNKMVLALTISIIVIGIFLTTYLIG